jgi:hypothetical protein
MITTYACWLMFSGYQFSSPTASVFLTTFLFTASLRFSLILSVLPVELSVANRSFYWI